METRVYHQKSKQRKCFIYKKADWTAIHKDLSKNLNNNIETMTKEGNNVNILWNTFKTKLFESLEKNMPSKEIKGNKNISWIRDRPFNLKGGGYGFLFRSEFFFSTTQELEYIFFVGRSANFFSRI